MREQCYLIINVLNSKCMIAPSYGNIFRVNGHLCGVFTGPRWIPAQRPVTRSFDVFFDLRLNKMLSKQSWGRWFEPLSCPLWRHSNAPWSSFYSWLTWQCSRQIYGYITRFSQNAGCVFHDPAKKCTRLYITYMRKCRYMILIFRDVFNKIAWYLYPYT